MSNLHSPVVFKSSVALRDFSSLQGCTRKKLNPCKLQSDLKKSGLLLSNRAKTGSEVKSDLSDSNIFFKSSAHSWDGIFYGDTLCRVDEGVLLLVRIKGGTYCKNYIMK